MIPQTVRAYMAGLFDAEGSIYAGKQNINVRLGNTDPAFPELFSKYFGGLINIATKLKSGKPYYMWNCPMRRVIELATALRPHGHQLRQHFYLASAYVTLVGRNSSRRESIREKIRKLTKVEYSLKNLPRRNPFSKTMLAYLAGLMDGDGYIRPKPCRYFTLTSTCPDLLKWLQNHYNGVIRQTKMKKNKQSYEWRLRVKEAEKVLPYLISHLRAKKDMAHRYLKDSSTTTSLPESTFSQMI